MYLYNFLMLFFLERLKYGFILELDKKMTDILPLAAMERLLKKIGVERVSHDAKESLKEILEELGAKIGKKSLELAKHSGRKTVKGKDIRLAAKD